MMAYSQGDLKEIVRHVVEEVMEKRDGLKKLVDSQEPHSAHVAHCPDCYKEVIEGMGRTSEFFCADCGLPLGSGDMAKKLSQCPNCKGRSAKPR